jgi:hypothetical protein
LPETATVVVIGNMSEPAGAGTTAVMIWPLAETVAVTKARPGVAGMGDELDLDETGPGVAAELGLDGIEADVIVELDLDETGADGELVFEVPCFNVVAPTKS